MKKREEEQPTITVTSEAPVFRARWKTSSGSHLEFSTQDEETFKKRHYALYLEYVDSKIHDLEIRVEV